MTCSKHNEQLPLQAGERCWRGEKKAQGGKHSPEKLHGFFFFFSDRKLMTDVPIYEVDTIPTMPPFYRWKSWTVVGREG